MIKMNHFKFKIADRVWPAKIYTSFEDCTEINECPDIHWTTSGIIYRRMI